MIFGMLACRRIRDLRKLKTMVSNQPHPAVSLNPSFSKKVFLGGLPPDIDENHLNRCFAVFGNHRVDWPHKSDSDYQFPPQGYAFVIFEKTSSVVSLLNTCTFVDGKFILLVSSLSIKNKQVQVRPWLLSDCFYMYSPASPPDYRLTVFVGGVPRPTTAAQLAALLQSNFGRVLQVTIDVDSHLCYPRGSARVRFAYRHSYMAAVEKRFLPFNDCEPEKSMEMKPFVLDNAKCDKCGNENVKFCGSFKCLSYLCSLCWNEAHRNKVHQPVLAEAKRNRRSKRHHRASNGVPACPQSPQNSVQET
ncbi:hypothetical protein L596_004059 [Steinernema carpocapsae]|uniref:RRM domain-containing protein n=1 Tax=Steinernema carpocapsae TaxID=34508 RepID=A0A4U8UY15_STECR|nr:hypothetical protein L596_004059 [Steinernema carpocapsae]